VKRTQTHLLTTLYRSISNCLYCMDRVLVIFLFVYMWLYYSLL